MCLRARAAVSSYLTTAMKPVVVFVLGAPGSGKGTQCERIVRNFGFVHLSAGDLLREERRRAGSQYGDMIEECITNGRIVPVAVTCSLIDKAMTAAAPKTRFLVDGFPRNADNLEGWESAMGGRVNVALVLQLECGRDECVRRCLERGRQGSGRTDDNEESLVKRFDTYTNDTLPIVDHYDKLGLVKRIEAEGDADSVAEAVRKAFHEKGLHSE